VNDTTGSLTVEGEFYGPVRADKAIKACAWFPQKPI